MSDTPKLAVTRLDSGYWHVRGNGPCQWAQFQDPWPTDYASAKSVAFGEAGDSFILALAQEGRNRGGR